MYVVTHSVLVMTLLSLCLLVTTPVGADPPGPGKADSAEGNSGGNPWTCPIAALPRHCPQPQDCMAVKELGYTRSGVYTVYVGPYKQSVEVYCDQETDGGGWLVFQRRHDGFTDFYRSWNDYANGFGVLNGEFWLGNHFINLISQQTAYKLRVDMEDFDDATAVAEYTTFSVGGPHLKYPLTVGGYTAESTSGDSLSQHNGAMFSTNNQDNDSGSSNCAMQFHGAWWYKSCLYSALNGEYLGGPVTTKANGVIWKEWKGSFYSLKGTEMKIRPL